MAPRAWRDEAGELHLMHGEDHRRRSAGAAENRADVDDVGGARAVAAEFGGNEHAEQLVLADGGEGFGGKARLAIDSVGVWLGDRRDFLGAGDEIARSGRFAGPGTRRAGESGLTLRLMTPTPDRDRNTTEKAPRSR